MGFVSDARNPATDCAVAPKAAHRPLPLRFVWHHVMPAAAGGETVTGNLIALCDNCHYAIHRMMYAMRLRFQGIPLTPEQRGYLDNPPRLGQLGFARQGFDACVAAGTAGKIPNEG